MRVASLRLDPFCFTPPPPTLWLPLCTILHCLPFISQHASLIPQFVALPELLRFSLACVYSPTLRLTEMMKPAAQRDYCDLTPSLQQRESRAELSGEAEKID